MRRQLVFMGLVLVVVFLNSCAVIGVGAAVVGGGTATCVGYEAASDKRCALRDVGKPIEKIHEIITDAK